MSKLSEIETAVANLPRQDQAQLLRFLKDRLSKAERQKQPHSELLIKWRGRRSGLVEELGGVKGYLNAIRGRDEDGH